MSGWVKLHRRLLDNPVVMNDADHFAIWCYLLLKATHEPLDIMFGGKRTRLAPGEFSTGRNVIASDLKINASKVQRVLSLFESEQQIEQRTDRQCRIITLKKWSEYQIMNNEMNNDRTTTEQRVNTKQEYKNEKNERIVGGAVELRSPSPAQEARTFFTDLSSRHAIIEKLCAAGFDEPLVLLEIGKFCNYWTERTKNGLKQRWETEKTFEVKRRLKTWFENVSKYSPTSHVRA